MGDVVILFKIMPDGVDTDLEQVKSAIQDAIDVDGMEEEAVAFGLKAIKVSSIFADEEGGSDEAEDALSQIDGVKSVEIEDMNRL